MTEPELPAEPKSEPEQNSFADRPDAKGPLGPAFHRTAAAETNSNARQSAIVIIFILLGVFALVNCAGVPFTEEVNGGPGSGVEFVFAIGIGIVGGQIGSLTGALVWSNAPFLLRLMGLWLLALLLFGCWFAGLAIAMQENEWMSVIMYDVARGIAASLPLISLAIQLPQWVVRLYFGWRIEPRAADAAARPRQALAIRDILIGTAIVALTLTAVRLAVRDRDQLGPEFWVAWAVAFGVLLVVSAVVNLPLVLLILRARSPAGAVLFLLFGPSALVVVAILIAMIFEPGGPDARSVMLMMLAATTCVAVSSAPLWLYRLTGHRLKMAREG
ncbi:MAG TPA: hypothetical protein VFV87_12710 [Pirellulaceae bacterium]|nr:hypothetical protein [Pirellulaceae bacterium]